MSDCWTVSATMKALAVILLFALVGCGERERASDRLQRQIHEWIPAGTPLISAQQIMEQQQFSCSIASYTNKQAMIKDGSEDLDAHWWDTSLREDGKSVSVTNITHLEFKKTNAWGVLTYINGRYSGGLRVMVFGQ